MAAHRTRHETIDCTCSPQRPHGDQHVYQVHGCGCEACRSAYQQYLVHLQNDREDGFSAYVDAAPVAARIRELSERGVTTRALAEALGRKPGTLYQVARLARPRCRRDLAEAVLEHPVPALR